MGPKRHIITRSIPFRTLDYLRSSNYDDILCIAWVLSLLSVSVKAEEARQLAGYGQDKVAIFCRKARGLQEIFCDVALRSLEL